MKELKGNVGIDYYSCLTIMSYSVSSRLFDRGVERRVPVAFETGSRHIWQV